MTPAQGINAARSASALAMANPTPLSPTPIAQSFTVSQDKPSKAGGGYKVVG
jgi:hypothetical protein